MFPRSRLSYSKLIAAALNWVYRYKSSPLILCQEPNTLCCRFSERKKKHQKCRGVIINKALMGKQRIKLITHLKFRCLTVKMSLSICLWYLNVKVAITQKLYDNKIIIIILISSCKIRVEIGTEPHCMSITGHMLMNGNSPVRSYTINSDRCLNLH